MTYFIARFPQYNNPVTDPKPEDYLEASRWHETCGSYRMQYHKTLAEKFYRTYYRIKWANETAARLIEIERVR